MLAFLLSSVPHAAASAATDGEQIPFWCSAEFAIPGQTPAIPEFLPGEVNHPAPSGLTLLGTAATRLLHLSSRVATLEIQAEAARPGSGRKLVQAMQDQTRRIEDYRKKVQGLFGKPLPDQRPSKADQELATEIDHWAEDVQENLDASKRDAERVLSQIEALMAAGAKPDVPMVRDLCITPRDLMVKASREYPHSEPLQTLIRRLPPEPVPLNEAGRAFIHGLTIRQVASSGAYRQFPELQWTPERIAETLQGDMRPCLIPEQPRLSVCPSDPPVLPNVVGIPGVAQPSPAVDTSPALPRPPNLRGVLDWHAAIAPESRVAQNWFLARDEDRCVQLGGSPDRMSCDGWFPIATRAGVSLEGAPYHSRTGPVLMSPDSSLPDGYHLVGEPAEVFLVRAGRMTRSMSGANLASTFIWPDFSRHRVAAPTTPETMAAMLDRFDRFLERWPSVVNFVISEEMDCDAACKATVSLELVQAVADWKHHVRPAPIDVLFAVDTPSGLFVDNNYLVATAHLDNLVAMHLRIDPSFGSWNDQKNDVAIRNMTQHSVVAKMAMPFVGYSLLPEDDRVARDPRIVGRALDSEWVTFPMQCALERTFESSEEPKRTECARYSPRLRLALRKAALAPGVVARLDGKSVVLSERQCLVDGRDNPIPGWEPQCRAAELRTPLANVFRHEVGHWLGVGHVKSRDPKDQNKESDVMDARLPRELMFGPMSRAEALRIARGSTGPAERTDEEVRR